MSSADDEKKKLDKIIDAEKSSLTKTLDNLEIQITVADQNGLFVNKRKDFEDIVDKVNCARRELEKKGSDLSSCSKALYQVIDDLENLERAKPLNWRLSNRYGLQIWLYLIAFLSLVFLFYYFNIDGSLVTIFGIQQQGIDAAAWGVVGGILRGLD